MNDDKVIELKKIISNKRTQVCILLDETASMSLKKKETLEGVNTYLNSLHEDKGDEVLITLTNFNSLEIRNIYCQKPISEIDYFTDYDPNGMTPLYDAIGKQIATIEKDVRPTDLVLFVILTDGEENSSVEYTLNIVKAKIKEYEEKGWKFVFLGVGIDAFSSGSDLGFKNSSIYNVNEDKTDILFSSMSHNTMNLRSSYSANMDIKTTSLLNENDRNNLV